MSDTTPQRIGDYEIIRELGHGGMGKVFLVRNVLSDRVEAMKIILPDLAARSEFVSRFTREIKTLASLDHPNIAALRTAFTAGDQFVMVMEYVDGVTLADRLQHGPLPVADAVNYTSQVLAALSYAHARHVIHRDIKPGNMMLTPQGLVKLMDFGLARSTEEVGLTATGATLGSLDYASPEQVQSLATDERSDLYSVGVSLYQMVTGQRMFSATSSFSIMQAQVRETPRQPIEIVPALPQGLNDVIMKAVAKDPAQRYQTADVFRDALASYSAGNSVAQATPTSIPSTLGGPLSPAVTPGVMTPTPIQPGSPFNRSLLLVVGVVLVAALVAGDAVYKAHQQRLQNTSPASPATTASATATSTQANASVPASSESANAQVQAPPPVPSDAPSHESSPQSAPASHNPAAHTPNPVPQGPSEAELQAQQAALDQKRLLDAMENEIDQLDGRAESVESGVGAIEQQMHQDGLGLRGDVVTARSNMRNDLAKAKQALDAGDAERSRHYLDLAHHEIEKLEKFLGRR